MNVLLTWLFTLTVAGISLFLCFRRKPFDEEWRHGPEPNWRCRRGGVDYY